MVTYKESLHEYRMEDAWPVMFDDFVSARENRNRV